MNILYDKDHYGMAVKGVHQRDPSTLGGGERDAAGVQLAWWSECRLDEHPLPSYPQELQGLSELFDQTRSYKLGPCNKNNKKIFKKRRNYCHDEMDAIARCLPNRWTVFRESCFGVGRFPW
jgi:hypothetical protein